MVVKATYYYTVTIERFFSGIILAATINHLKNDIINWVTDFLKEKINTCSCEN